MTSSVLPYPAPTAGLNTRDGSAMLQPNEARVLENWLPDGNSVRKRKGYLEACDGVGSGAVGTLTAHRSASGEELIAVADGQIWDASGANASSIYDGSYTDNVFQTASFNEYLFGVNGTETPWRYDGSTHSGTGFSGAGLTITNLVNIEVVRSRIWCCEAGSADVWYGGLGSITGTLSKFQASQLLSGGYMMAVASWSRDAGDGMDDMTVFIASTGQVLVYTGDPASTFSLIGSYFMPRPIGRNCYVKIGGQLAILTEGGLIPLEAAMNGISFDSQKIGTFGKTAPSIKDDYELYKGNSGWEITTVAGLIYINVPVISGVASKQYVYNTRTGAWATYTGLPAASVVEFDGFLYFGGVEGGFVWKHDGATDNGGTIVLISRQSFQGLDQIQNMVATSIRVDMSPDGTVTGKLGVDVDYVARPIQVPNVVISSASNLTPWGSDWGLAWNQKKATDSKWFSATGSGRAISPAMVIYADAQEIPWYGSQVMVTSGSIL